jgi:hemerythrin
MASIASQHQPPTEQLHQPFATWRSAYLTGHPQIDREHQELFTLVNTLHRALQLGADRTDLQAILADLADHTSEHFQQEELLMQSNHYPRYDRHKQAHDGLKNKIVHLLQQFDLSAALPTVAVTQFLTDWLVHHIQGEDRKMTKFFQEQRQLNKSAVVAAPHHIGI